MSQLATLEKILHIKDNEKHAAQLSHIRSVEWFEKVALDLYHLLKKKETAEETFNQKLEDRITITELQELTAYIEQLNQEIYLLQEEVNEARQQMNKKKDELTHKHIEFKKIEKLIDLRRESLLEMERKNENMLMDEISIRQYMNQN